VSTHNRRQASTAIPNEALVRRLLRRAAKPVRPSSVQWKIPFAREADPNREFADDRNYGGGAVWFFGSLSVFVILYVIYVKLGSF
jgi:hypothetical protein